MFGSSISVFSGNIVFFSVSKATTTMATSVHLHKEEETECHPLTASRHGGNRTSLAPTNGHRQPDDGTTYIPMKPLQGKNY